MTNNSDTKCPIIAAYKFYFYASLMQITHIYDQHMTQHIIIIIIILLCLELFLISFLALIVTDYFGLISGLCWRLTSLDDTKVQAAPVTMVTTAPEGEMLQPSSQTEREQANKRKRTRHRRRGGTRMTHVHSLLIGEM